MSKRKKPSATDVELVKVEGDAARAAWGSTPNQMPLRLPDDLRKSLEREAKRTGLSRAEVVRIALRAYLGKR